jgi:hypothetical protein
MLTSSSSVFYKSHTQPRVFPQPAWQLEPVIKPCSWMWDFSHELSLQVTFFLTFWCHESNTECRVNRHSISDYIIEISKSIYSWKLTTWTSFFGVSINFLSWVSLKINFSELNLNYNCLTELIAVVVVRRLTLELGITWAEMSRFLQPGSEFSGDS